MGETLNQNTLGSYLNFCMLETDVQCHWRRIMQQYNTTGEDNYRHILYNMFLRLTRFPVYRKIYNTKETISPDGQVHLLTCQLPGLFKAQHITVAWLKNIHWTLYRNSELICSTWKDHYRRLCVPLQIHRTAKAAKAAHLNWFQKLTNPEPELFERQDRELSLGHDLYRVVFQTGRPLNGSSTLLREVLDGNKELQSWEVITGTEDLPQHNYLLDMLSKTLEQIDRRWLRRPASKAVRYYLYSKASQLVDLIFLNSYQHEQYLELERAGEEDEIQLFLTRLELPGEPAPHWLLVGVLPGYRVTISVEDETIWQIDFPSSGSLHTNILHCFQDRDWAVQGFQRLVKDYLTEDLDESPGWNFQYLHLNHRVSIRKLTEEEDVAAVLHELEEELLDADPDEEEDDEPV